MARAPKRGLHTEEFRHHQAWRAASRAGVIQFGGHSACHSAIWTDPMTSTGPTEEKGWRPVNQTTPTPPGPPPQGGASTATPPK